MRLPWWLCKQVWIAATLLLEYMRSNSSSNEVLDVWVALSDTSLVSGSPVTALDRRDEREDYLEPDAADAHPEVVEVPAEYPGGGDETSWFNELHNKQVRQY